MNEIAVHIPPRTPYEETVAAIWRDVLGRSDVGVLDNFFDLGGHSLLAVQVSVRIRKTLGADIPVQDIFESPTVAALAAVVAAANGTSPSRPEVTPWRPGAESVLSFDQQRLWLESQLRPGPAYNVHGRRRLRGHTDVTALERSIRAIITRHEVLRTRFPLVDGQPIQLVDQPGENWRIEFEDLSAVEADRYSAALLLADQHATTAFDLTTGPLFKCLLIKLSDTEHLLSVTMHHIVSDAWSIGLFLRELSRLYGAGGDLGEAGLPPLPVQYRDYAAWQRECLTGDALAAHLDYWRDHLASAPPALSLPVARRRSPAQGTAGGRVRLCLTAGETSAVRELCKRQGVTPFMVFLAAYATVLGRWSGQEDVVIGVPIATRKDAGTAELIGFFVNTLPLRIDLSGNPAFADLLGRVRSVALDGYAHGEVPFDAMVKELLPPRDPTRTPLFQVALNMVDLPEESVRFPDVTVEAEEVPVLPSKFDLMLNVQEVAGAIRFELAFHEDRYGTPMMRVLLDQFGSLVRAVAAAPGTRILEYPLEQAGHSGQVAAVRPGEPAPHLAVERYASLSADRVAVSDSAGEWTYRQLDAAAGRVARELEQRHSGSAARIGLVKRRTAGFVAAVLACMRAHLLFSLIEPGTRPPGTSTVLDHDMSGLLDDPPVPAHPEPGQRGQAPDWAVDGFGLTSDDNFALLSGSSAHALSALCSALTAGAALFLPDGATLSDAGSLVRWLETTSATVIYLNPPLLRAIAATPTVPHLPALRYAFIGNEGELTSQDVSALKRLSPSCRCVSVHGATRTGQPRAVFAVPAAWSEEPAPLRVPLGVTGEGAAAIVLTAAGQPAAIGEVGEICFAGQHTGDLGRRLHDETLEFIGRATARRYADATETAAALRDLPGVRDAIMTEYLDIDGRATLTAYVTSHDESLGVAKLRQHLVGQVPEYLVPGQIVVLDELPLTADGDYDLSVLPVPGYDLELADTYVAPRTPVERKLTAIFEELLGVDRVSIHDTFFELNGFSLLANQLAGRVHETFQCQLSLRDVFESPTVEGLAQLIVRTQAEKADAKDLEALLAEIE